MEKINQKINQLKENHENIIIYLSILALCIIICSPLLQMHIASDTYNFMDLGYFEYPSQFFLRDARVISSLASYIGGILNLPYNVFIIGMEILAVIIVSISIYYLYKTVVEKLKIDSTSDVEKNKKLLLKVLIIMASFILVFNCMGLEYLLYVECSVMCLSVMLSILAARIFTKKTKFCYLKSFLLVVLATFCYQGAVNVFLPLTILFLFIDKDKKSVKELVKDVVISCLIIGIAYILNILVMGILNTMLGEEQGRVAGGILNNLKNFAVIINYVINVTLITNYNLWPTAISLIVIVISLIIIAFQKKSTAKILQYLFIVLVAFGISVGPVFFMKTPSMEARMAMSIGAIPGLSMLFLLSLNYEGKILKTIITLGITVFFIYNCINTIQIFGAHIATNKVDKEIGLMIKYELEKYENETGNTIENIAVCKDKYPRSFPNGWDKKFFSFTQRAFDNFFCIREALNYFCNRKFNIVSMDQTIYEENFKGKDWITFSNEQLVFEGNTMYMCTY